MTVEINYDRVRNRIRHIKDEIRLPDRTPPHYAYSAMEGGPVVTDTEHWYRRFQESASENRTLRADILDYKDTITRLASQLESLGVEPLMCNGELEQ